MPLKHWKRNGKKYKIKKSPLFPLLKKRVHPSTQPFNNNDNKYNGGHSTALSPFEKGDHRGIE
jgi:hypothetical protein